MSAPALCEPSAFFCDLRNWMVRAGSFAFSSSMPGARHAQLTACGPSARSAATEDTFHQAGADYRAHLERDGQVISRQSPSRLGVDARGGLGQVLREPHG